MKHNKWVVIAVIIAVLIAMFLPRILSGQGNAGQEATAQNTQTVGEAGNDGTAEEAWNEDDGAAEEAGIEDDDAAAEAGTGDAAAETESNATAASTSGEADESVAAENDGIANDAQTTDETDTSADAGDTDMAEADDGASYATEQDAPVTYTMDDVYALDDRKVFAKSALEHIFNGSVNAKDKGSGYHYAMIEDADGEIVEGTVEGPDENGVYTANVTVRGKRKDHYSSFFPDDWSPEEVVEAIKAAREDALANDRVERGSTWVGYVGDMEIHMYLDKKDKVISAYPVMQ